MIPDFLRAIWGDDPLGSHGEIRHIRRDGRVSQDFIPLVGAWEEWAARAAMRTQLAHDVYFGVRPRLREGGKADDVSDETNILWADVDGKKADDVLEVGKWKALTAINRFPIQPQVLVDSGGGYHAYWLLERPVPHALAAPVMKWIATDLVGDNVHDKPRVLRVPGTYNLKRERPVLARLLRIDLTHRYRFSDFEALMPLVEPKRPHRVGLRFQGGHHKALPEWLSDLIEDGAPAGQRSETCFRVMVWLLRHGRTPGEIRAIFFATPNGIGQKLEEKSSYDGARWLDYTLKAAEAVA